MNALIFIGLSKLILSRLFGLCCQWHKRSSDPEPSGTKNGDDTALIEPSTSASRVVNEQDPLIYSVSRSSVNTHKTTGQVVK